MLNPSLRSFGPTVAALLLGCLLGAAPGAAQDTAPIPWRPDVTFSRTSVEDDVRSVLRALLSANGLSVIFRPGVEGKVSFNFRNMSPRSAFEQLVGEYDLRAGYNAATQTVTIAPGDGGGGAVRRFITLQNVDWPSLRQMLVSFGIGIQGVVFDPSTSVIGVTGPASRVAQIEDLVKTLEAHHGTQRDLAASETQRLATAQRSDYERRTYQDAMNVQTRVFRLRFADVGPSTRNFHGRSLTVPGILETLQAMLGTNAAVPPYSTQGTAPVPFRPAAPLRQLLQGAAGGPGMRPEPEPMDMGRGAPPSIGRPNISIDQRTNSVIVRGSPAAIEAVAEVLRQIDKPVKMVEIEVIIATAQVGVVNQLGVAYRGRVRNGVGFDTGTSGGGVGGIGNLPGLDPLSLLPITAPGATAVSFVLNGSGVSLEAQLQALAQRNLARVLSAPHLVTMDNTTARITRSEDLYVPVDTGGLNGQGLSEIQTGLKLEITPSIVPAGPGAAGQMVRLTLNATNSAPGPGRGSQINVNSQEVQTDVLVPDGGTFVIGGLFDDSRVKGTSGIPGLKDIPLLGQLFRTDSGQQSLGQTVFFITPRVIDQQQLVNRDIAIGAETSGYIDGARRRLGGVSDEIGGLRPGQISRTIEEDQ